MISQKDHKMNYKVTEMENGRKMFHIQLPDGMTMDQANDWLAKFKHEVETRSIPSQQNFEDFHVENPN
jgi:hypothetical protein